jgi:hypothetical protein
MIKMPVELKGEIEKQARIRVDFEKKTEKDDRNKIMKHFIRTNQS